MVAKSLLDSINDDSDGSEDADYVPTETRRTTTTTCQANHDTIDASTKRKAEAELDADEVARKRRLAAQEWDRLMQVEQDAKRERETTIIEGTNNVTTDMVEIRRPRNYAGTII